jgi:hydroxymethylglutaryl-CoA lyase
MADLPKTVHIVEEGPREGFQFERQAVPTARKIELIEALAETGLDTIQRCRSSTPGGCRGGAMRMPWWQGCGRASVSRTQRSG